VYGENLFFEGGMMAAPMRSAARRLGGCAAVTLLPILKYTDWRTRLR
jgi:hypothetical protein